MFFEKQAIFNNCHRKYNAKIFQHHYPFWLFVLPPLMVIQIWTWIIHFKCTDPPDTSQIFCTYLVISEHVRISLLRSTKLPTKQFWRDSDLRWVVLESSYNLVSAFHPRSSSDNPFGLTVSENSLVGYHVVVWPFMWNNLFCNINPAHIVWEFGMIILLLQTPCSALMIMNLPWMSQYIQYPPYKEGDLVNREQELLIVLIGLQVWHLNPVRYLTYFWMVKVLFSPFCSLSKDNGLSSQGTCCPLIYPHLFCGSWYMQDIAVVPLLVILPVLETQVRGSWKLQMSINFLQCS